MLSSLRGKPQPAPPLPRTAEVMRPAPAASPPERSAPIRTERSRTLLATHEQFAEEAIRAGQRYLDQVQQIESLIDDRDEWRNRALLGEGEIKRLEKREADLLRQIDERTAQVIYERDAYKRTLAEVGAQYNAASKILLDGFAAIAALQDRLAAPAGTAEPAKAEPAKVATPAEPQSSDPHDDMPIEPLPSAVRAGPRREDE